MGLLFYHVPNIFLPYDTFFDNEMWESSVEIQIFFRSISLLSIIVTIYFPSCRYIIICYEFKGITTLKVVYETNKNLFIYNIKIFFLFKMRYHKYEPYKHNTLIMSQKIENINKQIILMEPNKQILALKSIINYNTIYNNQLLII